MSLTEDPLTQESSGLTENTSGEGPHEFSLVVGGPLFQLLRRFHLSGDALEGLYQRIGVISLIAWLPLLLLSFAGPTGLALFLKDVEVQVRLLVALPTLIAAELIVHLRTAPAVHRLIDRRIVLPEDLPRFDDAIKSATGLRNSAAAHVGILVLVYTIGLWVWNSRVPIVSATWYAMPGGRWHLTTAGYWYVFVSIPIVQFVLLCWYWRFFVWCYFLWRVSRIKLNLICTHPDHCAGLSFLGRSAYAFGPILFAQGTMLAGVVASRVLSRGEPLISFRLQIFGLVAFFVLVVLGPLLVFTPQMAAAKRRALAIYGQLAQDYVESFERKWGTQGTAPVEELLGTADIQSLADLSNSYSIVSSMSAVPFGLRDITRLAAATAAPFLPLLLTVFSLEELIIRAAQAIF
ncbi:MAG: hypothetical protein V4587_12770 [Acidobacteriota bacterium]